MSNPFLSHIKRWICRQWGSTSATQHRLDEWHERVYIDALRVIIVEESPGVWSALGVEIDYAASGKSIDEVRQNFERGLALTIGANIRKFGTIERLLRFSPPSEWVALTESGGQHQFSLETLHEIPDSHLPYQHIAYLRDSRRAA